MTKFNVIFRLLVGSFCLATLLGVVCLPSAAEAKRVALVIGNAQYEHAARLANPKNDATDMSRKLADLGFEVVSGLDLDLRGMRDKVREFARKLDGAEVALFYYAGHGLQVNGENYLAPVDAQLRSYLDLEFESLPINLIVSAMERSVKTNLVFLDACRDNPLADNLARSMGTRSGAVGRGLAKVGSGLGTLLSFATQPGNVALDGKGRNSPFTKALLKHLGTPGQGVSQDLVYVRREVLRETNGQQVPWENSSLTGEVILREKPPQEEVAVEQEDRSLELAYWETIKSSDDPTFFEAYLQQFPDGTFARLAKLKIASLNRRKKQLRDKQERAAQASRISEAAKRAEEKQKRELAQARKAREDAEAATAKLLKQLEDARRASEELKLATERQKALAAEKLQRASSGNVATPTVEKPASGQAKQNQQLALLEPTPSPVKPVQIQDPKKDRDLVRSIQTELNRIGCSAGKADGLWGRKSESAVRNYGKHGSIKLSSTGPSNDLLRQLKQRQDRVCPLVCGRNQEVKDGRCINKRVASAPTKSQTKKATTTKTTVKTKTKTTKTKTASSGQCPGSPYKAGAEVFSKASLERNAGSWRFLKHPCGKRVGCKINNARRLVCKW